MVAPFPSPITARYFFKFRKADTGLTSALSFVFYQNSMTGAPITQPTFSELGHGIYYFDRVMTGLSDPEIVFQIDGGSSLPDDIRYISDTIHPKEYASESVMDYLMKSVGLLHENSVMDNASYESGKLKSARIRLYSSKADAEAAGVNRIYEYQVNATYTSGNLSTYTVTRTYPA
ncbi:MAG: hypothetical protein EBZ48_15275 [Proteobacteria bacterium]|nr:hypothetical protein [Pseudomonadota bacterium]